MVSLHLLAFGDWHMVGQPVLATAGLLVTGASITLEANLCYVLYKFLFYFFTFTYLFLK